jgi:hypothetical protein
LSVVLLEFSMCNPVSMEGRYESECPWAHLGLLALKIERPLFTFSVSQFTPICNQQGKNDGA